MSFFRVSELLDFQVYVNLKVKVDIEIFFTAFVFLGVGIV